MEHYKKTGRKGSFNIKGDARGFTLVEIMAVLAIVAILAAIAVPVYTKSIVRAREAALSENLYVMRDAIDKYYGLTSAITLKNQYKCNKYYSSTNKLVYYFNCPI